MEKINQREGDRECQGVAILFIHLFFNSFIYSKSSIEHTRHCSRPRNTAGSNRQKSLPLWSSRSPWGERQETRQRIGKYGDVM